MTGGNPPGSASPPGSLNASEELAEGSGGRKVEKERREERVE